MSEGQLLAVQIVGAEAPIRHNFVKKPPHLNQSVYQALDIPIFNLILPYDDKCSGSGSGYLGNGL